MADTEAPVDGALLTHFNMRVDDLIESVFEGIDDYCRRHPEITEEIAKKTLSTRACDMAEGYEIWIEEGANG